MYVSNSILGIFKFTIETTSNNWLSKEEGSFAHFVLASTYLQTLQILLYLATCVRIFGAKNFLFPLAS